MENDFDEENISEMIQRLKEMERDEKISDEENECIKLSLGYSLYYGEMVFVIPRNTFIPCSQRIQSLILNHKKIILNVYEGERLLAKENKFLGNCILDDISEKEEKVEIKFSVDINYILKVSLNVNDKNNELRVKLDKLDDENIINEKIKESQESKEEDKRILENNKMKSNLINYCFKLKREGNDEEKIKSKITLNWVKTHQNENKEIYEKKLEGLKNETKVEKSLNSRMKSLMKESFDLLRIQGKKIKIIDIKNFLICVLGLQNYNLYHIFISTHEDQEIKKLFPPNKYKNEDIPSLILNQQNDELISQIDQSNKKINEEMNDIEEEKDYFLIS